MTLAIMSIAVTAIICAIIRASASDADLLVASFMPFSLDLGMSHRCLGRLRRLKCFYSEHPSTSIRFDDSPVSEYRQVLKSFSNTEGIWLRDSRLVRGP